ncbi:MAG TPA: hypothetical protein VD969_29140 [Symbiobacteriaceae bacterium]|nr:hypothetical protein [Symbiobacteriaceae bacterium]
MGVVLLVNVGNHDLQPREPVDNLKAFAAGMVASPQVDWASVQFPLLAKYLAYVKLHKLSLGRVVLVGTDQPETARPQHRAKDTEPIARLMERWLREKTGISAETVVYGGSPADWDEAYRFHREWVRGLDRSAAFLVGLTGGTQQLSTTLLLAAIDILPDVTALQATEAVSQPVNVGLGRRLRERDLMMAVDTHLAHRDFHAALRLLDGAKEFPADTQVRKICLGLLRYAENRACLRFQEAAQALSGVQAFAGDPALRAVIGRLLSEAAALAGTDLAPEGTDSVPTERMRLWELVGLAEEYRERGLLLELPALVYTFTDIALNLASDLIGVRFANPGTDGWRHLDKAWVEAQPELLQHLSGAVSDWQRGYNTFVALAIVEWFGRTGNAMAKAVAAELQRLDAVRKLRNRGPFGHGTLGVSEKDLKGVNGSKGIVETLRRVAGHLAPVPRENPFELVTQQVTRLMRLPTNG